MMNKKIHGRKESQHIYCTIPEFAWRCERISDKKEKDQSVLSASKPRTEFWLPV
jgi:hypothetical protein